ncbi:hypothetical protein RUM43_010755 [Polyplax serrata]|uniref:BING4 C-terminal domain-containing protein n=1 Tax=Polyplax serrata TaxID=468196 RepID=A0AAN8PW41_POLSC
MNQNKRNRLKGMPKRDITKVINTKKFSKYDRGESTNTHSVKFKTEQNKIARREKKIKFGIKQSVKSEVLLVEDTGFLEPDEDEISTQFTQKNIKNSVDLLSASKGFDLNLEFGPYRMNYTRNGRYLLLGGRHGHLAAFDWIQKKLMCEINVMEEIFDVAWFHQETMFAVAQKKWVYIYDNQGIEIHCIKQMSDIYRMLFLPYHFLLATVSTKGFISWLDVSVGKMVKQFSMYRVSNASAIALHPANAMVCIGEPNGVVSFWGPNSNKPAITKWCHERSVSSVAFDPRGTNFTTASLGGQIKIWDARNLNGPVQFYKVRSAPRSISMSHRGVMAFALNNLVEVYNDRIKDGITEKKIYLRHNVSHPITNIEFCPFEDVLGVAHATGFCSMLVPGCGEPNFDALEINPFQTKSQRQEAEVKALLGKIPADLITWDAKELIKVNLPSREEIIKAKHQIMNVKAPSMSFTPRKKTGRKAGSVNVLQRKKIMKEDFRRNYVKEVKQLSGSQSNKTEGNKPVVTSVLDRFNKKN